MTLTPQDMAEPAARPDRNALSPPQLADGVQLIGEYEGSGYREAPSLVRLGDGQVVQLPDLLYRLAGKADGQRTYEQLATELGGEIQRQLDPDDVRFLAEEKLRPLGILAAADGTSPSTEKADPFLAFRFRIGVVSEQVSGALGAIFKPLFLPVVVLAVLVGLVAADYWLFFLHGVAQALRQSLLHPGLFLPLFAAVVVAAALHEIGHAAACRYGGGHPGKMGCGLYLAWPAFYTDVTDAYRLSRRARLRTDLGGVYLNVVIVLATVGAFFATHFEPLLLLVLIEHLEIVHQLLPVIRLDGYYIVADLTGVPDLFARIGPILGSVIPGRPADQKVTVLKPWVRWAVTAWVLVVIPLLGFELLVVLIHLPRILATAGSSAERSVASHHPGQQHRQCHLRWCPTPRPRHPHHRDHADAVALRQAAWRLGLAPHRRPTRLAAPLLRGRRGVPRPAPDVLDTPAQLPVDPAARAGDAHRGHRRHPVPAAAPGPARQEGDSQGSPDGGHGEHLDDVAIARSHAGGDHHDDRDGAWRFHDHHAGHCPDDNRGPRPEHHGGASDSDPPDGPAVNVRTRFFCKGMGIKLPIHY